MTEQALLSARNITKRFGAFTALDRVSLEVRAGEVHAVCGENGAGKSTLIKLLSGVFPASTYEGDVLFAGQKTSFHSVRDATAAGIIVIHQELALVDEMTIAENLFLGDEPTQKRSRFFVDWNKIRDDARALLGTIGIDLAPTTPVSKLGIGHRQLVEIARALRKSSKLLILDEPTAALTSREVENLFDILRKLRQGGVALIYVSHRLDEIFAIADRITVLRDGRTVVTAKAADLSRDDLIRHMVGREVSEKRPARRAAARDGALVRMRVRELSVAPARRAPQRLSAISFDLYAGEILGIGGLLGSGRTELLLHLYGAWGVRTAGTVELDGAPLEAAEPRAAVARGIALVTEDRQRLGLVLGESVGFNLSLANLFRLHRRGLLDEEAERAANQRVAEAVHLKATGLSVPTALLSGGNQQKVVLGKALMTEPKVVLLDEPTRGVDVGAKAEIHTLIRALADDGCAVLLVSSELPELIGMSDRIFMMKDGTLLPWMEPAEATEERLLAAALGAAP